MKEADYNYPLSGGYFKKTEMMPAYKDYQRDFYGDFLRYLYFMLIKNSKDEYPLSIPIETILGELDKSFSSHPVSGISGESKNPANLNKKPIKRILIGEAPPPQKPGSPTVNYFYNPNGKWPAGTSWINAPMKAMFNGTPFATKLDFLIACARKGFLLLDLFPYAIPYSSRNRSYRQACVSAFDNSQDNVSVYPGSIMNMLNQLEPWIDNNLAIGYGLKSLGEAILNNSFCRGDFNIWAKRNNIILFSGGPIEKLRKNPINGTSKYLRVCYLPGPMGPHATLLTLAGF